MSQYDQTPPEIVKSPNNSDPSQSRRTALKKIVAGTGVAATAAALPERWAKPVMDRVLVPAHAQTSPEPTTSPAPTTPAPTTTTCGPLAFRDDIAVTIELSNVSESPTGDLCITSEDCVNYEAKLLFDFDGSHYLEGSGTVGGGGTSFDQTAGSSGCFLLNGSIKVTSLSASGADYSIGGDISSTGTLPVGSGCPSKPSEVCAQT